MSKFLKAFTNRRLFLVLLMGISSGLPLALTGGTLQAWMKQEGVDLASIGLFALVGLPYSLKFVWAPFMDRYTILPMGRRRGWMFVSQLLLILAVLGLSLSQPQLNLFYVVILSLLVSFFSASQDIVLDAWRREALPDEELGLGSSIYVSGYLFAFRMISGALALTLSDFLPWSTIFQIMAAVLVLGLVATFLADEPKTESVPRTLKQSIVEPFLDYFQRKDAWLILVFILLYKVGDNMTSQMSIPFYKELGFSGTEIGTISKGVGWVSLAVGGLLGGVILLKTSLKKSLMFFGVLQALSNFGFGLLAMAGKNLIGLTSVIAVENFATGMGTSAFVAFMAQLTNKRFTATQYALLTSFMGLPRTLLVAPSGYFAQSMGWFGYFVFCTVIAVPGLLLIPKMHHLSKQEVP